ncbi:hypothetical protein HY477_00175 [Candidatus Uhrbacteria bacterium]|nr:hypothetical protein [Candidatus Uhrbacteria bacterium]
MGNTSNNDSPKEEATLNEQMLRLTRAIEKANSFWRAFLLGVVRGLGVAIGATIIAAAVVALLVRGLKTLHLDQLFGSAGTQLPVFNLLQQFSPNDLERFAPMIEEAQRASQESMRK